MTRHYSLFRRCVWAIPMAIATLASTQVRADEAWPKAKPIRILIGYTAGSATDLMARTISTDMSRILGTPVVVENKPGAGGSVAAAQMLRDPADGYTVVVNSSAHTANPALIPNLPYDTVKDMSAVGPLGASMFVMLTSPDSPYKTVADVVERAKANPGKLNYGSGGIGSGGHLNSAILVATTGIDALHIPSRGTPEAITEAIAGRLDWVFVPAPAAVPMVKTGKLRARSWCSQPVASHAWCSVHGRGRLSERNLLLLGRHVHLVQDAAAHRRPPKRGVGRGGGLRPSPGKIAGDGQRPDADACSPIRPVCRGGSEGYAKARHDRKHQAAKVKV
ncbi:hypothetical protein LP417_11605 [Polaromonas sp. P1-6]|nr:hypothetical protein LP417_11605 [Polaromonas sp. P1-6]